MNNNSKNFLVTVILMMLALIIVSFFIYNSSRPTLTEVPAPGVACTLEAKLCPDGSSVGRTGPDCQFAECPAIVVPDSWKTHTDQGQGVTFRYPENLSTKFISIVDWPPQVQLQGETPTCTEAGKATDQAGATSLQTINNRAYCVTVETEGAAGSIYYQYAYGVFVSGRYVILTFSLRYPQCVNYDDPLRSQCQIEEQSLDVGQVIDQIVSTLSITPQPVI